MGQDSTLAGDVILILFWKMHDLIGQNLDYIWQQYPFGNTELNGNNYQHIKLFGPIEQYLIVLRLFLTTIPLGKSLAKRTYLVVD